MEPSTRTPEGEPNRCPVCGNDLWIEPSRPPGDAPCPHCGHLLWFGPPVPVGEEPIPRASNGQALERTLSQLFENALVRLTELRGPYTLENPITVCRRRLVFGMIPWTSFDCHLWIQGSLGSWRVLLRNNKGSGDPRETMIGADYSKSRTNCSDQGRLNRLGAWSYATGKWQRADHCEAASVYELVEDAISRAYDHYCESRKWR